MGRLLRSHRSSLLRQQVQQVRKFGSKQSLSFWKKYQASKQQEKRDKVTVFNREMLTLARESRDMTQTRFAEKLGISQAEVSKYETGLKAPSPEMQSRMAA